MNNFELRKLKNAGRERKGFKLYRANGSGDYLFIHFISKVDILIHGKVVNASPHTCVIFTPQCPHEFYATNEPLIHDWVHFITKDPGIFERLGLPTDSLFIPYDTGFISNLVKTMELEFINHPPFWDNYADGLLQCLFSLLGRELLFEEKTSEKSLYESRRKFEALRLDIYNDPAKERETELMASSLGYSRSRFSVLYKKLFDVSPSNDIINSRIQRAKYLLTITDIPISRISEDTGYNSLEHFIRQFKSNTGMSPSEFRKKERDNTLKIIISH